MTKPATKEALNGLHAALAQDMIRRLESGEATAADLGVIRQFLKDNGIDAVPTGDSPLQRLVHTLPFADPEEIARQVN